MKFTFITALIASALLVATPAVAENPYAKADGTWITMSGTVKSVTNDSFQLNYDTGVITVEMDDGDRDADAYKLIPGDEVTVTGMIDDDFFETTSIEASTVYVKKLGISFYASAVDEEDFYLSSVYLVPDPMTIVSGKVTSVKDEEFTIDTGVRMLTVEVEEMGFNPLDNKGYLKVTKGDRVSVSGEWDYDLFEGQELVAKSVVLLKKKKDKASS